MRALRIMLRWPFRRWLHRRCLRRIALLERALQVWPAWELEAVDTYDGIEASIAFRRRIEEIAFSPGARWPVDSHNYIQVLPKIDWLTEANARGLLYSGLCLACGEHGLPHAHEVSA